jgi:hypothetical protein
VLGPALLGPEPLRLVRVRPGLGDDLEHPTPGDPQPSRVHARDRLGDKRVLGSAAFLGGDVAGQQLGGLDDDTRLVLVDRPVGEGLARGRVPLLQQPRQPDPGCRRPRGDPGEPRRPRVGAARSALPSDLPPVGLGGECQPDSRRLRLQPRRRRDAVGQVG